MDLTPPQPQPLTPGDEPTGEQSHAAPAQHDAGTAARSSKEIGGKKFRVGAENAYVPFRRRTKRRRRMIAMGVIGLVLVGAGAYGVGSLIGSPSQASVASGCTARTNAAGGVVGAGVGVGVGTNVAGADAAEGADARAVAATVNGQLPAAAQIKLNVYNSTNRHGLAAATAAALKQRGFTIGKVTNDPLKANLTDAAEVRGASADALAMRVVAAEVVGSQLRADSRTDGTVDLVLGAGFTALASPDQVSAALKQAQQASHAPQAQAAPQKATGKCS